MGTFFGKNEFEYPSNWSTEDFLLWAAQNTTVNKAVHFQWNWTIIAVDGFDDMQIHSIRQIYLPFYNYFSLVTSQVSNNIIIINKHQYKSTGTNTNM